MTPQGRGSQSDNSRIEESRTRSGLPRTLRRTANASPLMAIASEGRCSRPILENISSSNLPGATGRNRWSGVRPCVAARADSIIRSVDNGTQVLNEMDRKCLRPIQTRGKQLQESSQCHLKRHQVRLLASSAFGTSSLAPAWVGRGFTPPWSAAIFRSRSSCPRVR